MSPHSKERNMGIVSSFKNNNLSTSTVSLINEQHSIHKHIVSHVSQPFKFAPRADIMSLAPAFHNGRPLFTPFSSIQSPQLDQSGPSTSHLRVTTSSTSRPFTQPSSSALRTSQITPAARKSKLFHPTRFSNDRETQNVKQEPSITPVKRNLYSDGYQEQQNQPLHVLSLRNQREPFRPTINQMTRLIESLASQSNMLQQTRTHFATLLSSFDSLQHPKDIMKDLLDKAASENALVKQVMHQAAMLNQACLERTTLTQDLIRQMLQIMQQDMPQPLEKNPSVKHEVHPLEQDKVALLAVPVKDTQHKALIAHSHALTHQIVRVGDTFDELEKLVKEHEDNRAKATARNARIIAMKTEIALLEAQRSKQSIAFAKVKLKQEELRNKIKRSKEDRSSRAPLASTCRASIDIALEISIANLQKKALRLSASQAKVISMGKQLELERDKAGNLQNVTDLKIGQLEKRQEAWLHAQADEYNQDNQAKAITQQKKVRIMAMKKKDR